MRCSLYARKSDANQVGVDRQIEQAEAFVSAKGWTLDPAHVFHDTGISGGTFDRPGLTALLALLQRKPCPVDALVTMDSSRLGREMSETLALQVKIRGLGVRVFFFQDGTELRVDTPQYKLLASVVNFGSEDFRFQIQLKTRNALQTKASHGDAVAGAIFGYDNVPVLDSTGKRLRVEFKVNESQAQVIRRSFQWCAEGHGIRAIASMLNAEGVPAVRGGHACSEKCRDETGTLKHPVWSGTWAASSITTLLNREMYRGRRTWGSVESSAPAIIPDDLWTRAQAQRARTRERHGGFRKADGRLHGRGEKPGRFLLSNLLRCGCGSAMTPISRPRTDGTRREYWSCSANLKRTASTCKHLLPMPRIEKAIISHFARLTPHVIEELCAAEYDRLISELRGLTAHRSGLAEECARLDQQLDRLAQAVGQGGQIPALLREMEAQQRRRDEITGLIEHAQGGEQGIKEALGAWQARVLTIVLASATEGLAGALRQADSGRRLLKQMLKEPVIVTPQYADDGVFTGWTYSGIAHLGSLAGEIEALPHRPGLVRIS